jgi:hypothetical protein
MPRRRLTPTASSARPSQTPLEGRADDAAPLTTNTVALPRGEALTRDERDFWVLSGNLTPITFPCGKGDNIFCLVAIRG